MIQKIYKKAGKQYIKDDLIRIVRKTNIIKIVFCAFNYLAYNQKIGNSFVVNILFDFLRYYIMNKKIKKVNL